MIDDLARMSGKERRDYFFDADHLPGNPLRRKTNVALVANVDRRARKGRLQELPADDWRRLRRRLGCSSTVSDAVTNENDVVDGA
jgi:hypothetical protein